MDISVTAAQPGRRRYLTLVMIFITVVICYVDRANLAVASMHIQKEFGITKAEMGYVFSAFAWLYTLCQIPGGWFLDRIGSRLTYLSLSSAGQSRRYCRDLRRDYCRLSACALLPGFSRHQPFRQITGWSLAGFRSMSAHPQSGSTPPDSSSDWHSLRRC